MEIPQGILVPGTLCRTPDGHHQTGTKVILPRAFDVQNCFSFGHFLCVCFHETVKRNVCGIICRTKCKPWNFPLPLRSG